jgi:hypothetical protein
VGAFVLLQPHKTEPVIAQPKREPPKPEAPEVPKPEASAQLTIKTVPADAQVLLDDARVANPFVGRFARGDVRHRLVVKANGYRSESQWITFDNDRDLIVKLEKGSGAPEQPQQKDQKKPESAPEGKPIYKGTKGKLITTFPE